MTKNETNNLISSLIKEIKNQNKIILDSIKCDSMTEEQLHIILNKVLNLD